MADVGEYGRAPQYGAKTGPAAVAQWVRGGSSVSTSASAPELPAASLPEVDS